MENYSKILKCSKVPLVIVLLIIAISIALFSYSSELDKKGEVEPVAKEYNELIAYKQDVENEYVEVTITDVPYGFAEEEVDGITRSYYFVYDQYDYMYIVRLMDSTYTMLENKYNENPEEFSYTLKGYIFEDPEELKELAISAYNEGMEEEIVNQENFRLYFGNTYLDEVLTPYSDTSAILIGIGAGIDVLALVLLILYITGYIKTKNALKKYDKEDLEYELSKSSTIEYKISKVSTLENKKDKIYLTDRYIVSKIMGGLNVLEYNELVWLYNEKRRINGIPTTINLKGFTNKKSYELVVVSAYGEGENLLIEIMDKIKERNPQVMLGFTKENQQSYKEIKKNK